ncbi:hypothetical protein [Chryseolinea sp. H1M3-3]|nr:hypothetical protein [Chryseolinea sp. H1M3-3]
MYILEDDQLVAEVIKRGLEGQDYSVAVADDGWLMNVVIIGVTYF